MYNGRALDRPVYRFLRLLFLLGLVHGFYLLAQEGLRAWELARERAALKEEVARARAEVERLKEEVRAARDPAYPRPSSAGWAGCGKTRRSAAGHDGRS